jgi:hypothetical protein
MQDLDHFIQIIEPSIPIPMSCDDGFVLDTDPRPIQIGVSIKIGLPDQKVYLPFATSWCWNVQPHPDSSFLDISLQFRTPFYQIIEDTPTDDVRMRIQPMIMITFLHYVLDDLVKWIRHHFTYTS